MLRVDAEHVGLFDQQFAEAERRRVKVDLAGFDFGKIEDIVDKGQQVFGSEFDRFDVLPLFGVQRSCFQQARHADDRVERRADFMAHVGQEDAFKAAAFGQVCVLAFDFGALPFDFPVLALDFAVVAVFQ